MESVASSVDQQSLVSSFLEIAVGQTADTARQFLQVFLLPISQIPDALLPLSICPFMCHTLPMSLLQLVHFPQLKLWFLIPVPAGECSFMVIQVLFFLGCSNNSDARHRKAELPVNVWDLGIEINNSLDVYPWKKEKKIHLTNCN